VKAADPQLIDRGLFVRSMLVDSNRALIECDSPFFRLAGVATPKAWIPLSPLPTPAAIAALSAREAFAETVVNNVVPS
jgi:hypothetical protein